MSSGGRLAGVTKSADSKPDQIECADQLERREQLGTGQNDRGNAEAACHHMDQPAHSRSQCGCEPGLSAAGQGSRRHIEDAGTGDHGNHQRRDQKQ